MTGIQNRGSKHEGKKRGGQEKKRGKKNSPHTISKKSVAMMKRQKKRSRGTRDKGGGLGKNRNPAEK